MCRLIVPMRSTYYNKVQDITINYHYNPVLNSFESVKMSQTLYLKALGLFLSDRECCMCSLSFDIFSQGRF